MDRFHQKLAILLLILPVAAVLAQQPAAPRTGPQARAKATKTSSKPAPPVLDTGERFLFVVDTSSGMRKLGEASRQTLFDLIFSGVGSRMTNGDTFGVWTFNEQPYAGQFPMQVWHSNSNLALASSAATFLKQHKYDGDARIGPLLTRLASVVRSVKDVNILIISDGKTPLQGTALDNALNAIYEQKRKEQKSLKKPFITTMVMRGGQLAHGDVTLPGEVIQLPPRTPKPLVAKAPNTPRPKPSAPKTNTFQGKVLAQAPPDPRTNFILRNPAPVNGSVLTHTAKSNTPAAAAVATGSLATALAPAHYSPPSHPSHQALTGGLATASAATPLASTNAPATVVNRATNSPTDPTPFSALVAATPVAAREKPTVTATASTTLAPANPLLRPGGLVIIGALMLLAALTMLFWGLRRVRTATMQPSFISRSMERR